jgi:hypothetical protein
MTETPLSDLIAAYIEDGTPQSFSQFLDGFRGSRLGVIAAGVPAGVSEFVSTAEQSVSIGMTQHAGGRRMALAFADPVAFARRFGCPFNAEISGEALLATILLNPECEGVLVNSALAEVSVVIDRVTAESVTRSAGGGVQPGRKPWWRFW